MRFAGRCIGRAVRCRRTSLSRENRGSLNRSTYMKRTVYSFIIAAAIAAVPLCAQEESHITGQVGAGFTTGLGRTGDYLDYGWNVGAGVGYNFNHWVGLQLNLNDSQMGINSTTLTGIGVPGGD